LTRQPDTTDKALIALLGDDGRLPLVEAATVAGISRPTVASRLRTLIADGVLRVAGLVDGAHLSGITVALVGLTVEKHRLDEKVEQIATIPCVVWAAVVTGRYDIMAQIATEEGFNGLYDFLNVSLRAVGGISSSEVFVVMKSRHHWMLLPHGIQDKWADSSGA